MPDALTLSIKVKDLFFDRKAVTSRVPAAKRRALSKAGAFVRRRARSSIRFRKAPSPAGRPPSAHTRKEPNLRTIFFAFEPERETCVIGPIKFNGKTNALVPELMEKGGTSTITTRKRGQVVRDKRGRVLERRPGETVRIQANYSPRPFMGPARDAEAPNMPRFYEDQIK